MASLTIGIIGCGSLGTAILQGLMRTKPEDTKSNFKLSKVNASVGTQKSAQALQQSITGDSQVEVHVYQGQNDLVARESDFIILATPPDLMSAVLSDSGVRQGLRGKILVSVLAGVTSLQLEQALGENTSSTTEERCSVFRAMLNLAASLGESATAIEASKPDVPADRVNLVDEVFGYIGNVVHMPGSMMDACTPVCGSTPAFIALFLDALVDGAVAGGVPRQKAQSLIVQALQSTATLLKDGTSPSKLRETVCAMPGCTIQGILTLEQGGTRGVIAKTMTETIIAASKLG